MIKLVAIDLDGTLFSSKKEIHKDDISALQKLKELGYHVVIATGRPTNAVSKVLDILGFNDESTYVVSFNGAAVTHYSSKKIIHSTSIPKEAVDMFYADCVKFGLEPVAFDETGDLLAPSENNAYKVENEPIRIPSYVTDFTNLKEGSTYFKALAFAPQEILDEVTSKINSRLHLEYNVVRTSTYLLEVINKDTDKWVAIKTLAKHLDVPLDTIMCIGDADNDLSMIKNSKIGVAMGNAFEAVKEASDFITLSNDEAGVSHAINKLILNK